MTWRATFNIKSDGIEHTTRGDKATSLFGSSMRHQCALVAKMLRWAIANVFFAVARRYMYLS